MRIGAIIQARVSSTRLPGKILKELPYESGITVLEQVSRRLKKSKKLKLGSRFNESIDLRKSSRGRVWKYSHPSVPTK